MKTLLEHFESLKRFPFGKRIYSRLVGMRAPFFAKIHPLVTDLRPGGCTIQIKDRRSIRNHIGTVNAGALCTLCELTAGLAVDASIPRHLRWIPREMTVRYLKKARGTLHGICRLDPDVLKPGDVRIPIEIQDPANEMVLSGEITFYLSERKTASS